MAGFVSGLKGRFRRRPGARALWMFAGIVSGISSPVPAQYMFNPNNADEQVGGIRYFGSAKDVKGALVSDATLVIDVANASFVLVTDDSGRFRKSFPLDMTLDKVSAKCFKAGYQFVRLHKRPGVGGPRPTAQIDCVLRRTNPA